MTATWTMAADAQHLLGASAARELPDSAVGIIAAGHPGSREGPIAPCGAAAASGGYRIGGISFASVGTHRRYLMVLRLQKAATNHFKSGVWCTSTRITSTA